MSTHHSLRFHPNVEEKLDGLGDDFLQRFYSSTELITENPLQFPKVYKNYHRFLMRKFPYAVYYVIKDEFLIVMGVFHHARDPKTIKSALENRND